MRWGKSSHSSCVKIDWHSAIARRLDQRIEEGGRNMEMSVLGHIIHDVITIILCLLSLLEGICMGMVIQEYQNKKDVSVEQEDSNAIKNSF